ncbi:hypothetical protein [Methylorubrum thiocyanatum]|uniref:hypothetical protein n=1 Tax=Methylorubrum thiocyanatum TaxID=47958 RepID=UPI00398C32A4
MEAARGLTDRLGEINAEKQAAREAAEAKRLSQERSFKSATVLFGAMLARVEACVAQANKAFDGTGVSLGTKVEPLKESNAGSIKVSLLGAGEKEAYFRIVGNAKFHVFVHELNDPKYGPFQLTDAEALPYEDMFNQFIRSVTRTLKSDVGGANGT